MLTAFMQLDARPSPEIVHDGELLEVDALLGVGATSYVYQCASRTAPQIKFAAKVLKDPSQGWQLAEELRTLQLLKEHVDAGVLRPIALLHLDNPTILLMQPVGVKLGCDQLRDDATWWLGDYNVLLPAAVTVLQQCHGFVVHRDLRPENILLEGVGDSRRLCIADW
jgi:serine/threonine protein kinase